MNQANIFLVNFSLSIAAEHLAPIWVIPDLSPLANFQLWGHLLRRRWKFPFTTLIHSKRKIQQA